MELTIIIAGIVTFIVVVSLLHFFGKQREANRQIVRQLELIRKEFQTANGRKNLPPIPEASAASA